MENCLNCLYANEKENGGVMCDKVLLIYGKEVHIEADRVELPCPSHSSRFIEETRCYFNNEDMRKAEDACEICGRLINMYDEDTHDVVVEEFTVKKEDGTEEVKKETVQKCKICIGKGRNKFA